MEPKGSTLRGASSTSRGKRKDRLENLEYFIGERNDDPRRSAIDRMKETGRRTQEAYRDREDAQDGLNIDWDTQRDDDDFEATKQRLQRSQVAKKARQEKRYGELKEKEEARNQDWMSQLGLDAMSGQGGKVVIKPRVAPRTDS